MSIVGSFTASVIYDKREKKRNQKKWCKLVEHIAKEPLDSRTMPRKLTIFLEAPPMDGLRSAQDHFKEYVKPILVSSGLDWEFIQGRKEGDIRASVADRIRTLRQPADPLKETDHVAEFRKKNGTKYFDGPGGDLVIGRHAWKEYVRGLHEGWLGPLSGEPGIDPRKTLEQKDISSNTTPETTAENTISQDSTSPESEPKATEKSSRYPFYISTDSYSKSSLPPEIPTELEPSIPISFPHILGFLNTPKRVYRFLNRRYLAESIGRDTAAIILSNYRPYHDSVEHHLSNTLSDNPGFQSENTVEPAPLVAEQQAILENEEIDWHKSVWASSDEEFERIWANPIILDPRVASRMRKFELSIQDQNRAKSIEVPEEEIEGWVKGSIRDFWRAGKAYLEKS